MSYRPYKFKVGDRVYYKENGPDDKGTVIKVIEGEEFPYEVQWDKEGPNQTDQYCVGQLSLSMTPQWEATP